ncbi:hypothetical protein HDU93_002405, partial [Gonapodya sp. JEL0774]
RKKEAERDEVRKRIANVDTEVWKEVLEGEEAEARISALATRVDHRTSILDRRRKELSFARDQLAEARSKFERELRPNLSTLLVRLLRRRRTVALAATEVYPVNPSRDDSLVYEIAGVKLPNSAYEGLPVDTIALALGYTAHLLVLLARALDVPLRYPVKPMGSRATVRDAPGLKGEDFPLFGQGSDRYRFDYGVLLLNKNVEQLANHLHIQVADLRNTLPNLHAVIEKLREEEAADNETE